MRRDIFEQIKGIVDDKIRRAGKVPSLHGVSETEDHTEIEEKRHEWYAASVATPTRMPSLQEVMDQYTHDMPGITEVNAVDGVAMYPRQGGILPRHTALLLSSLNTDSTRQVQLEIEADNCEISIYLNGIKVASGRNFVKTAPQVTEGSHSLAILAYGGRYTSRVSVAASRTVELSRGSMVPEAPNISDIDFFYLDPNGGNLINRVRWNNDAQASSWAVYRAATENLGEISGTVYNADGTVTFGIPGVWEIAKGERFYTEYFLGGAVQAIDTTKLDASGNPYTEVTAIPSKEAPQNDAAAWNGNRYFRPQEFHSLGIVSYSGEGAIEYEDNKIHPGTVYIYKVTAFGFLSNVQESDYSLSYWIFTNDEEHPQGVAVTSAPKVEKVGRRLTVNFLTPPEPDFAGVRVYGPYVNDPATNPPLAFSPSEQVLEKEGRPERWDQVSWQVEEGQGAAYFYIATFDRFGNEQRPSAWTNERTGETYAAAWYLYYDGPELSASGSATAAIGLTVVTDANDPESMVHNLECKVWPKEADFFPFLNGVALTSTSTPALSGPTYPAPDTGEEAYALYTVTISRVPEEDQRFVATAKGAGLRPDTISYTIDRDDVPGLSGTSVESRVARPTIRAVMDDDARYLRLLDAAAAVVWSATKTADVGYDQTNVLTLTWTRASDLLPDEKEAYTIEASKDGVAWNVVWEGEIQGPPVDTNTQLPRVWFEVLNPTLSTYDNITVRVHAENVNGDGNLKLSYRAGAESLWTTAYDGINTTASVDYTINRGPRYHSDIILHAKAEASGLITETHFVADFDRHAEVVGITAHPLFDVDGTQKGWRLEGVVDDDTKSVVLSFAGTGVTFVAQTLANGQVITAGATTVTVDTSSFKTFSIECTQSPGGMDTLEAVPYDRVDPAESFEPGETYKVPLVIAPVSEISWQELSPDKLKVVIQAEPSNAVIKFRTYNVGATKPAFSDTSLNTNTSRLELKDVTRDVAGKDLVLEWFAVVGSNAEQRRTLTVDQDRVAEIHAFEMVQDQNQNVVRVSVLDPGDDSYVWRLWARRGSQPTEDGTTGTDPSNDYLRFEGPVSNKNISHSVSMPSGGSATWYFIAQGTTYVGKDGPLTYFSLVVTDVSDSPESPALEDVTISKDVSLNEITIQWTPNGALTGAAAGSHEARVYSRVDNDVWSLVNTVDPAVLPHSVTEGKVMTDTGVTVIYDVKIELWTTGTTPTLMDTYRRSTKYYNDTNSGKTDTDW